MNRVRPAPIAKQVEVLTAAWQALTCIRTGLGEKTDALAEIGALPEVVTNLRRCNSLTLADAQVRIFEALQLLEELQACQKGEGG